MKRIWKERDPRSKLNIGVNGCLGLMIFGICNSLEVLLSSEIPTQHILQLGDFHEYVTLYLILRLGRQLCLKLTRCSVASLGKERT